MNAAKTLIISSVCMTLLSACGEPGSASGQSQNASARLDQLAPVGWADVAAKFVGPTGGDTGYVVFKNTPGAGVIMRIGLQGLSEGWHGIHLHQIGDCSDGADGFKASGGHIDPDSREHGLLNPEGAERADLPNIYAGADGRATAEIFNSLVALYPSEASAAEAGPYPLMDSDGFAVIIHANPDDHMAQPIGGAGKRVACAVVTPTD